MKRPDVQPSNYAAVYSFYKDYQPHAATAWTLYAALRGVFSPHVTYADGAEEMISDILAADRTLILAANHIRAVDPCVIAAAAAKSKPLRPLVGNTFIPSKAPIFQNTVVRYLVDGLGAVPVFRAEDALKTKSEEATSSYLRRSTKFLMETCIARLNAGQHMGIFPEGTRNKIDPDKVQKLQGGVGAMVCRVTKVPQPALVPIGIHYDEDSRICRGAALYIGHPSTEKFARSGDITEWLQPALQHCVDQSAG